MPPLRRLRTSDGHANQIAARLKKSLSEKRVTNDQLCALVSSLTEGGWIPAAIDITHILSGRRVVTSLEIVALARALDIRACYLLIGDNADADIRFAAPADPESNAMPEG